MTQKPAASVDRPVGWKSRAAGLGRWAWQLWLPLTMLALLPMVSNFIYNRFEVAAQELILPVLLGLILAAIIGAAYARMWRRDRVAGYVAAVMTMLVIGGDYDLRLSWLYDRLRELTGLPATTGWGGQAVSLLWIALVVAGSYMVGRLVSALVKRMKWAPRDVYVALSIAIVATFIFKAGPMVRDIAAEWPQFFYRPPQITGQAKAPAEKPDIYYIVLDRYASQDVLKSQFAYDNTDFTTFLTERGYFVNPSSHNNYPYTAMSIASTMTADYLSDIVKKYSKSAKQTTIPFDESIRNSPVADKLKSLGYRYDLIGNWYETSNLSRVADRVYQPTGRLTVVGQPAIIGNFSKNVLTESVFFRFIQSGVHLGPLTVFDYANMGDVDMHRYALEQLKKETTQPAGGRFIFAHILIPHDPYYFKADGTLSANTGSDNEGQPIKQKYLEQVKFINDQMKDIVSRIDKASDGKAVVVLQSDEGPYPIQLNDEKFVNDDVQGELRVGDMRKWSDRDIQMKYGNLAAYHIPAAGLTAEGAETGAADPVNIFRLIFNTYFGMKLPYRADCYYAYPNGRDQPERFADITQRLTGQKPDAKCQADGNVKP